MHGMIMVIYLLTALFLGGFGNYLIPLMVGARDMVFPYVNMLSYWVYLLAVLVLVASFFAPGGPTGAGWTLYPPQAILAGTPGQDWGIILMLASLILFIIGFTMGGLNYVVTVLQGRTRGMTMMRLPLTVWGIFTATILALLAFPALFVASVMMLLDRVLGTSFFMPAIVQAGEHLKYGGGSPILFQHLFWFFGHPEVYIAIVPGIGIVSHVLITSMRRPLLSHKVMIGCMSALAFLSYMVYGHHMFVSGMNPFSGLVFSFPTLVITIPATIIVLIWIFSLYGSKLRINSASLFALGFISMFVSGGVSGFFLAQPSLDIYLHATYFVVGHFHMVMAVAALFGIFTGTYFWFPKMTGRMMNEGLGKLHFWLTFVGTYAIFMPFHYLGMAGNVRRYQAFVDDYMQPLLPVHKFITVAAFVTGAAQLIFLYNLIHSRFRGAPAPANPWEATSLEWTMPSPPPFDNFGGKHPVVYHDPYQYGIEGSSNDYVMQDSPEQIETVRDEK